MTEQEARALLARLTKEEKIRLMILLDKLEKGGTT